MQSRALESLSEHLLRAGVAHRHVRRYMRELHDHYDDVLREELSKGLDRSVAEQTAWARLGNEEDLARSVLAQPALRSTAARFPVLVFGAAPVIVWLASLALVLFALSAFADTRGPARLPILMVFGSGYVLLFSYMRVLPVIYGVLLLIAAARQRTPLYWPIIGAAIVAVLGGTTTVELTLGATFEASLLGMHSTLLPMIFPSSAALGKPDTLALAAGLMRAASMLGIAATPYVIWRIRQSRSNGQHSQVS
jgi:hypothetical protein